MGLQYVVLIGILDLAKNIRFQAKMVSLCEIIEIQRQESRVSRRAKNR